MRRRIPPLDRLRGILSPSRVFEVAGEESKFSGKAWQGRCPRGCYREDQSTLQKEIRKRLVASGWWLVVCALNRQWAKTDEAWNSPLRSAVLCILFPKWAHVIIALGEISELYQVLLSQYRLPSFLPSVCFVVLSYFWFQSQYWKIVQYRLLSWKN